MYGPGRDRRVGAALATHRVGALAGAGHRVLTPDLRGYGLSSKRKDVGAYAIPELAADVLAMVASLGQERVNLVGHDLGAALTWYLVRSVPVQVHHFAHATHWLHEEEPEAVNALLLEALTRPEAGRPA